MRFKQDKMEDLKKNWDIFFEIHLKSLNFDFVSQLDIKLFLLNQ